YVGDAGQLDYTCAEPDERELENFIAACEEIPETVCVGGGEPYRISSTPLDDTWKSGLRDSFTGPVEPDRVMAVLALALLGGSGKMPGLGFIKESEFYEKLRAGFKLTAAGFALFTLLSVGFLFYRHRTQIHTLRETKAEIGRIYKTAVPTGRLVKPIFQLKQRLKELKGGLARAGFGEAGRRDLLWILKLLSERLQTIKGAKIDEIIYEEKIITIKGKSENFNSVNRIREALEAAPAFKSVEVADSRAFPDTKKVSFKMRLQL
ncbi:MAG: PilN domain-containing protein, partial [Nitrospinota bacterium]